MKFKIGDRVRCISGTWLEDVKGIEGTIVKTSSYETESYGIRFDEPVKRGKGHGLNGLLNKEERVYGYYIREKDLELCKKSNIGEY